MLFDKNGKNFRIKPFDNAAKFHAAPPSVPCLKRYTYTLARAHLLFNLIQRVVHRTRTAFFKG
jgi:hypothetical protein